jgi:hypothetical protein
MHKFITYGKTVMLKKEGEIHEKQFNNSRISD